MKFIKGILIGIVLIFLISLFLFSGNEFYNKDLLLSKSYGDVNGDHIEEMLVLTRGLFKKYGKEVVIYEKDSSKEYIELYREDFSDLKPWKIDSGDVDGDGIDEISVGVYKKTIFHPIMAKRPFIYNFDGERLIPKWRGSRLSRPLTNYTFYDIDKDGLDEIISIEELEDKRKVLNSYKWRGFGFEGFIEGESYDDLFNQQHKDGGIYLSIKNDGRIYRGRIIIKDGNLVIERVD